MIVIPQLPLCLVKFFISPILVEFEAGSPSYHSRERGANYGDSMDCFPTWLVTNTLGSQNDLIVQNLIK